MTIAALLLLVAQSPYDHGQPVTTQVVAPPKVTAPDLETWHRKNYAWVQVGQKVRPRPAPTGLGAGRWAAFGVWQTYETRTRKVCYGSFCRMERYQVLGPRIRIDLATNRPIRSARPRITAPRRRWIHYGGDSGQALRNHLRTAHGVDGSGLSDQQMRYLHGHAHEGTLDRHWTGR